MFTQKTRWLLLLIIFIYISGHAQRVTTFQKRYGTTNEDYGSSIVALPDKGFLLAGITGTSQPNNQGGDYNILIIRIDSLGRQKWAKLYKGASSSGVIGSVLSFALVDMALTPDGNVAVYTNTGGDGVTDINGQGFLFKINLDGNILWSRKYNKGDGGFTALPGGGFALLQSFLEESVGNSLIIADDTGGVVWEKSYAGVVSGVTLGIAARRDGGYLMTGQTEKIQSFGSLYPIAPMFIRKIDKNGNVLWAKTYDIPNSGGNTGYSIIELPDRSVYACGSISIPYIIKTDSSGKVLWAKYYDDRTAATPSQFLSMIYDSINNVFDISFSAYPSTYQQVGIIRLDTSGKIIFNKVYGPSPKADYVSSCLAHDLVHLSNGGFVFLQSTSTATAGGSDFYFMKTDNNGNTDSCNYTSYPFYVTPFTMTVTSYTTRTSDVSVLVGSGCTTSSISVSDSFTCPPIVAGFGWDSICLGETTQFIDSSYYGPLYWQWNFGDGSKSTLENPTHKYAKAGTYDVKLVTGNSTNADSITKTVTIYPKVFHSPLLDTLVCGSTPFSLRAKGGLYYTWRPDDLVNDSTSASPTLNLNKSVQFVIQSSTGGNCITFDTVNIVVDNKPAAPQIDYATVKSNSEIDFKFQRSDSNDVSVYEVFKSVNGGAFSLLQTINNLSNTDSFYVIKDDAVNAATNKYAYKILAVDSCRAGGDTSTAHQTMVLAVKQLGCTQTLQLNWNAYIGWAAVKNYKIFRSTNGGMDSLITTLASNTTTYNDTGLNHNNLYCYKILALDKADSFVSQSNTVCKQTFFPDTPQVLSASKISTSTTNGTVVIKWNSINKANLAYNELYFSRDGINFSQIGGHFLPGIDSFAQTGFDTKDSDYYYYLVTVDSCGAQSIKSPTSKTMTLTVTVGELLHKLNWTPYLGFKIKEYYIERLQKGQFVTIDSVPGVDTFSREFPAPCNYAIRYRIAAIGYDSGEVAWSDTMGRQAIDTIPSDPPIMLNATVLNGSSAKLNFIGSDSLDTYEFAIQRSTDGNWGTAGAILFTKPSDSLQFIDTGINTVKNHYCYTIIALDSCLNASESDTFCLINLQGKGVQLSDSLNWYPFAGYGLNDYAILTLNPSGIWDTLTTVNATDTNFYNANLKCNQTITYKIAGKEKSGTRFTFSDSVTLTPFDTIKPPAPTLYYATVLPNQTVKLSWQWNPTSIIKYFEIWRSTNHKSPVLIDSVTDDSVFIDKNANVKDSLYSYSVIAIDSCNTTNRSKPSQTDSIMLLSLYSLYCSPQVQVHWTPFTGLPNGVSSYNVLRSTDGVNFNSIGSVNASATMFVDNSVTIGQQYYYKTEAVESKSGYVSYSDTLGIIPSLIPLADSAQLVYATVLKSDETHGEIYIQWKRAALNDTNARGYYVYSYNTANGKYALLQNITNLNDTSIIQENINTIQDAYKYYIITYNVCDVGINSNIHKTVLLTVQNNNLEEQLNWTNYMGIPVKSYSVYKSEDGGPQFLVNNAGLDSAYSDSNITCNHNFTYQIQAILANGEISFSDSITVKSFDTVRPITEPILVATVVRTGIQDGRIELDWKPAIDKELAGYNIYRSEDGLYWSLVIGHWPGTSLIDTGLDTYNQPYYYKIQPVDSCGNIGNFTTYHETIHLKAQSDNGFNQLNWNGYAGWGVRAYLVYRNGILIDTVANNVFAFKDTAVICQNVYQYLIKAIDSVNDTIISASNTDSARATNNIPPQKVYIKTVTVSSPNKAATISWTPSPSYDVKNYFIYRKSPTSGTMTFVDSTTNLSYIDSNHINVPPLGTGGLANEGDCYYVFARDHCGNQSDGSNEGCIIILSATNQQGYNQLTWNSYRDWYDDVQGYNVYENSDSTGWQLIGTTSPPAPLLEERGAFTDSKLGDSVINFCYQVEAVENPGQYNQLSRSTVVCIHQDATVFIPNSFTPYNQDGLNDFFGPQGDYIKSYDMKIYNRWGEQVYTSPQSSKNPPGFSPPGEGAGWDGKFQGQYVQQGVYIYLITVTDYNGKQSYFKGTITMFE